MNSTHKSVMLPLITTDLGAETVKGIQDTIGKTFIIIDGHALIQSIGMEYVFRAKGPALGPARSFSA